MMKKSSRLRAVFIISVPLFSLILAAIFIYRYQILQYSTEKIVRHNLPDYISVDRMTFNFRDSRIAFRSFKILNPPGFSGKYLIEIGDMECRYAMRGNSIIDGLDVLDPIIKDAVLMIERRRDGITNLQEMPDFLQKKNEALKKEKPPAVNTPTYGKAGNPGRVDSIRGKDAGGRGISDFVTLPQDFNFKDGKVVFLDGMVSPGEYKITLDNINATLHLELDSAYAKALKIATIGAGNLGGKARGTIRWDTKYDPTASALTMSNRFNVSGVDIMTLFPYYDRYSPLAIKSGYFSGLLIFDFDHGSIGSTNEIVLSKFTFSIKPGYEYAQYLETTVPDLVKYFTSSRGDIVFDFKIKGLMSKPQFYLGPISKQAVGAMAIDKIVQALANSSDKQANTPAPGASGAGSDMEKAAEYIKMIKSLMKENK